MDETRNPNEPNAAGSPSSGSRRERITCADYREEIHLVVGGDLEPEVMDLLVAHLASCEPCANQTATAAAARDALLGGLEAGAHQWSQPRLWPGVAAALGAEGMSTSGSSTGKLGAGARNTGTLPDAPRRAPVLRLVRRAALPLAAAAALLLILRPWRDKGATDPTGHAGPNLADQAGSHAETGLESNRVVGVGGSTVAGGAGGVVTLAAVGGDPVFDDYGDGLIQVSYPSGLEPQFEPLPGGPKIPFSKHDIDTLIEAGDLEADVREEGRLILIRRESGGTLASLQTR